MNNPWKFAAGYLDSSTSLYKFGTRYDDPTLGRWTQLDSAGTGYVYAGDDPVNAVDPSGASLSPAGTAAVILGLIAAGCGLLTIEAIISILGIPASPIFAICAGVAALGAAYETAVAFFFG